MNNMDERISAALHAAVDGIQEQDLRPADPPAESTNGRRSIRWIAPLLAAAAVVVAAAVTVAVTSSPSAAPDQQPGGNSPSPSTTSAPPTTAPVTSAEPTGTALPGTPNPPLSGNEPLWPFATAEEARQWETVDGPNGHSPWHADAEATALFFASGYLNFGDITEVTSSDIGRAQADIGVGYNAPNEGGTHSASVIHLVRFGGDNAPWEVVGASAEGLSISTPNYGDTVASPVTVDGRITGVDESIAVAVRSLDGGVDVSEPVPGGGENTAWTTYVPLSDRRHGVLTIVASTGGHVTAHERFAVVGVEAAG